MEQLNTKWDGHRVRSFTEVTIYDAFMEAAAFDAKQESEKRKELLSTNDANKHELKTLIDFNKINKK